jgi:Xaa-Pro aminopeptidase
MKDQRMAEVLKLLKRNRLDAVLISDPLDVAYFSGFSATDAYLLITARKRLLFSDFRYRNAATAFCRQHPDWRFIEITEHAFAFLRENLDRGSRVGLQSDLLSLDQYDQIRRNNRGLSFVKIATEIAAIPTVKTAAEVSAMRRAAAIADKALAALLPQLRRGMSEAEAARLLDMLCLQHGSEGPSFETILLFGERAALPHGRPSARRLRRGDWILIDFGCRYEGLCSDMTRTMVAGTASARQQEIYAIVAQAQLAGRKAARAGLSASQLDAVVRGRIEKAGHGAEFGHATGHGVGRRIHEKPRISKADQTVLQPDMVVTVEPGIYIEGFGGVRIEDMVAITATGCKVLTRSPRELIEVDL